MSSSNSARAVLIYTLLRIALFAVIWVLIEFLTPIHGVWAAVFAILISGAISIVLLDRQRGRVGQVAAGFFGGINRRIEASARAEDDDVTPEPASSASTDAAATPVSGEREQQAQDQPVDQQ